ncbi:hypothetical protein L1887_43633 [Cichorium endivia]|nr:hypothetical protein L1887_43633 [Cichorium endivia]
MRRMWVGGIGWSGAAIEATRFLCSLHIFASQQSGGGCKQSSRDPNLERGISWARARGRCFDARCSGPAHRPRPELLPFSQRPVDLAPGSPAAHRHFPPFLKPFRAEWDGVSMWGERAAWAGRDTTAQRADHCLVGSAAPGQADQSRDRTRTAACTAALLIFSPLPVQNKALGTLIHHHHRRSSHQRNPNWIRQSGLCVCVCVCASSNDSVPHSLGQPDTAGQKSQSRLAHSALSHRFSRRYTAHITLPRPLAKLSASLACLRLAPPAATVASAPPRLCPSFHLSTPRHPSPNGPLCTFLQLRTAKVVASTRASLLLGVGRHLHRRHSYQPWPDAPLVRAWRHQYERSNASLQPRPRRQRQHQPRRLNASRFHLRLLQHPTSEPRRRKPIRHGPRIASSLVAFRRLGRATRHPPQPTWRRHHPTTTTSSSAQPAYDATSMANHASTASGEQQQQQQQHTQHSTSSAAPAARSAPPHIRLPTAAQRRRARELATVLLTLANCHACNKPVQDPVTLPCGHSSCLQCIKDRVLPTSIPPEDDVSPLPCLTHLPPRLPLSPMTVPCPATVALAPPSVAALASGLVTSLATVSSQPTPSDCRQASRTSAPALLPSMASSWAWPIIHSGSPSSVLRLDLALTSLLSRPKVSSQAPPQPALTPLQLPTLLPSLATSNMLRTDVTLSKAVAILRRYASSPLPRPPRRARPSASTASARGAGSSRSSASTGPSSLRGRHAPSTSGARRSHRSGPSYGGMGIFGGNESDLESGTVGGVQAAADSDDARG